TASDCAQPIQINLSVNNTTASNGLIIHPNPVSDILFVDGLTKRGVLKLFNIEGKLLLEKNCNSITEVIDTKQLTPAVYILQVITQDNEISTIKFVKE